MKPDCSRDWPCTGRSGNREKLGGADNPSIFLMLYLILKIRRRLYARSYCKEKEKIASLKRIQFYELLSIFSNKNKLAQQLRSIIIRYDSSLVACYGKILQADILPHWEHKSSTVWRCDISKCSDKLQMLICAIYIKSRFFTYMWRWQQWYRKYAHSLILFSESPITR